MMYFVVVVKGQSRINFILYNPVSKIVESFPLRTRKSQRGSRILVEASGRGLYLGHAQEERRLCIGISNHRQESRLV